MLCRFNLIKPVFRWIQALGIEFWLPIPLVAIGFWLGSDRLTTSILNRPYSTENRLQTNYLSSVDPSADIISIEAKLDQTQKKTEVKIRKLDSSTIFLEVPTIELKELQAALAQELKLSPEDLYSLVRYQIVQ
ncbi:conserved hypothetical protein [Gloeothece citriformis PCC 7424]|uniref:Uncharacterized protein n=1 Tax=Gloeothece citriformis (strain PCC 7424) TaxID=65393 RepID=B7KKG5_GLOC7|nr:hypothetical protein [Gloeothece citriformis]ACK72298.1 conserved hypothetical protein [Gloeothece citriformis PCC 7424]